MTFARQPDSRLEFYFMTRDKKKGDKEVKRKIRKAGRRSCQECLSCLIA